MEKGRSTATISQENKKQVNLILMVLLMGNTRPGMPMEVLEYLGSMLLEKKMAHGKKGIL